MRSSMTAGATGPRDSRPGRKPARRLTGALGIAAALVLGDAGTAFASAKGCTGRNGPGNVNFTCVDVVGEGTRVNQMSGSMESYYNPPRPLTLCDVDVEVYGTLIDGTPFSQRGRTGCSHIGIAYLDFKVNRDFRDGSQICARTTWRGEGSSPACITVIA